MEQLSGDRFIGLWTGGYLLLAVLLALIGAYIIFSLAKRFAHQTDNVIDDSLVRRGKGPAMVILPLLVVLVVLPFLQVSSDQAVLIRRVVALGLTASIGWLMIGLVGVFGDFVSAKYRMHHADNLAARQMRTQAQLLRRIGIIVIVIVTLCVMLMTIPNVRLLGASLFASAGVVGLVIGIAARPVLSNLIAGIQIALTDPILLDDVVIVEGEWGWVEEIGTTYVVVRVWDQRRLVVPLSYFLERPFQNWTREGADILGTVFVYTDYSIPVDEVRQELHRILEASGIWDKKVWGLQVTNATAQTMELRALMSAPSSPKAWDLRCHVREKLIEFLREKHPQSLPKTRAEIRQSG